MFNLLFILIILMCVALLFLKPVRKFILYCVKNIAAVIFFILLNFLLSILGFSMSINIFSLASALLLGLPGISLALFISLII